MAPIALAFGRKGRACVLMGARRDDTKPWKKFVAQGAELPAGGVRAGLDPDNFIGTSHEAFQADES